MLRDLRPETRGGTHDGPAVDLDWCGTMKGSANQNQKPDRNAPGESSANTDEIRIEMFEVMGYVIEKLNRGWRLINIYNQLKAEGRITIGTSKQFYRYRKI